MSSAAAAASHSSLAERPELRPPRAARLWLPKRVLVTPAATEFAHGRAMVARAAAVGAEVVELRTNRLTGIRAGDERGTYALAKSTLAVVTSPPSRREKLQPIPPSADWQFHLAEGCPAHCQYCYLAGSLAGPPVVRAYANLEEILAPLARYEGEGTVTSTSSSRADEGTTFEASCYTDPLGIEHLSGSLAAAIRYFGTRAGTQLRFTTKFDAVEPLLGLDHQGRTRVRFSVNAAPVADVFEGGTARMPERLHALRRLAQDGYPVGLTIAPIMPMPDWEQHYAQLLDGVAQALAGIPRVDLTAECITHRFTPGSKEVLLGWYPRTRLDLDTSSREVKRTRFGSTKYVYRKEQMRALRDWFERELSRRLPIARLLYWT